MLGQIESGWAFLQAGNVEAAVKTAKRALQDDPNHPEALELLCECELTDRNYRAASETIEQLLRLSPNNVVAHKQRIMMYIECGWQDDAKQALNQFRETLPSYPNVYRFLCGYFELIYGSPARASQLMRALLAQQPDDIGLQNLIAIAEFEARNPLRALPFLEQVLAVDAQDDSARRVLAFCRFRTFRFTEARNLAKQALRLAPRDVSLRSIAPLCLLVWFPPFLLGHGAQWLIAKVAQRFGAVGGHIAGLGVLAAMFGAVIALATANANNAEQLPTAYGVVVLVGFLAGIWAVFTHYVVGVNWGVNDSTHKGNVRLRDY